MTQSESSTISRRQPLAMAGIPGVTSLACRPAFAEDDGIVPTMVNAAAKARITVQPVRRNISVLEGSGGNIAVLTGKDGKILVEHLVSQCSGDSPVEQCTILHAIEAGFEDLGGHGGRL